MLETLLTWLSEWKGHEIASVAVALFALLFSLVSAAISARNKRAEERRAIRTQLGEIIHKLQGLQVENTRSVQEAMRHGRIAEHQILASIFNHQLATLSRQALFLIRQWRHAASDVDCSVLATSLAQVGDPEAETLWRKAIALSPKGNYRVYNTRGYADYLFNVGRLDDGRKAYQRCLAMVTVNTDYAHYTNGYTHRMWGINERNIGAVSEAEEHFTQAHEVFARITNNMMKDMALRDLEYVRSFPGGVPFPVDRDRGAVPFGSRGHDPIERAA